MKFNLKRVFLAAGLAWMPVGVTYAVAAETAAASKPVVQTVLGMPEVRDAANLYSETRTDHFNPVVKGDLERIYVPNLRSNNVSVIDPKTLKVVDTLKVGKAPQHVVPSWDLRTLWVANNAERAKSGSLTPIDPRTAKAGKAISVDDPYNLLPEAGLAWHPFQGLLVYLQPAGNRNMHVKEGHAARHSHLARWQIVLRG